jgi:tripartite-type tricarboxylate transporter receptor subunit TctC
MGFAVRAGTPKAVIERLNAEIVKALRSPEVTSKIEAFGVKVLAGTPEQFTEQLNKDQAQYTRLVRETNLKVE